MKFILIDTSWLVHRSSFAFKDLSVTLRDNSVLRSGHLYGVMKDLRRIMQAYPQAMVIFCLDGNSTHGKTLDPNYKANRVKAEGAWNPFDDLGVLVNMISSYSRTKIAFHKDLEADDIISYFVYTLSGAGNVCIYSADNDMLQLLGDGVVVSRSFADGSFVKTDMGEYLNDPKWYDKYVCTKIEALPLFRALIGDSSDNLSGFPRLKKKLAKEWAEEYLTASALVEDALRRPGKFPANFIDFLPKLRTNYEIMRLPTPDDLIARHCVPHMIGEEGDEKDAFELFNLYKMRSLTQNILSSIDVDDEVEAKWKAVRDVVNAEWRKS